MHRSPCVLSIVFVLAGLGCQGSGAPGSSSAAATAPATSALTPGTPPTVPPPASASLALSAGPATPAAATVAAGTSRVALLQARLQAGAADVAVLALTVTASGTAIPARDVVAVELAVDTDHDGRFDPARDLLLPLQATFASSGVATLSSLGLTVPAAGSLDVLVLVTFSGQAVAGTNLAVSTPGQGVGARASTGAVVASGAAAGSPVTVGVPPPPGTANDVVWVEDALPAGAAPAASGGDSWTWVSANPLPLTGALASQSNTAAGVHEHSFQSATAKLAVARGDALVAYVFIDTAYPPSELMLQWSDGNGAAPWEHRAYWGADAITNLGNGTRVFMGALPAAGKWVRLEVPATLVGCDGLSLTGMAFTLYGGRATWDHAGKCTPAAWIDGAAPRGATTLADGGDSWTFVSSNPTPVLAPLVHQSNAASYEHQHWFQGATDTLPVGKGDTLFAWVYLDPANVPGEVMLQWSDGKGTALWEHRAYWGADSITWFGNGTRTYMGPLPAAGKWVKLEIPASAVGCEGLTLDGMGFTLYGGRASWDQAGKE